MFYKTKKSLRETGGGNSLVVTQFSEFEQLLHFHNEILLWKHL